MGNIVTNYILVIALSLVLVLARIEVAQAVMVSLLLGILCTLGDIYLELKGEK